mmetsp:Transcript_21360/g.48178  ORF Transcript_21360/g.48178 Transcript_21360/m.48178 type:complete len:249 (-) Transcript_21360:383-1129(-)|eukprot:CAMPEP_0172618604 /NCGR_PEP_ID=MMETSP1068-20121228/83196_1 /TAXON_ID=35684 /ORGANISM="Pseudopedinella elastica, Strain CCMP716" /LENGTH=248 /DNA_ID=CAMNT_0013424931 /DNA_START=136 /DNA_END=882 /DNA_ORIENTATION=-
MTEFKRRVTAQGCAHVCLAVGCTRAFPSVLEVLADVTRDYVATIGSHSRTLAEAGGRSEVTAIDVLSVLKHMGPEAQQWKDLQHFAFSDEPWQQPFNTEIPRLPVRRRRRAHFASTAEGDEATIEGEGGEERPAHVPDFLPPFPPKHTYQSTETKAVKRSRDPAEVRQQRVKRKHEIAQSLTKITATTQAVSGSVRFGDQSADGKAGGDPDPTAMPITTPPSTSGSADPKGDQVPGLPFPVAMALDPS